MNRIATLLRVIRPHIVIGGALGYMLGIFFPSINSRIDQRVTLLGYLTIFLIDLSTHYSNDLYDVDRDKQANWKPFGSKNVLIKTPDMASWIYRTATLCSLLSLIFAVLLVTSYNISSSLLVLTIIGNILGWSYSHPSIHLKAKGLGETAIAFGTGFIIPAIGYIVTNGALSRDFLLFVVPLVLYGFILSVYLEIPDIEVDKRNQINNLTVRLGYDSMMRICLILTALNTVYYISGIVPFFNRFWLALVSLFPFAGCLIGVIRNSGSRRNTEMNTFLAISGLFAFLIGLNILLVY
jgi:1,4-dihydroxy-2-naphthoate octaprenyltransferase